MEQIGIEGNLVTLPYLDSNSLGQPIWEIELEDLAKKVLNPNDIAMRHSKNRYENERLTGRKRVNN
jgi:hypothetical protein